MFALPFLAACERAGILDPKGPVGAADRLILINSTGIMLVVVVPVIVMALSFAWWFRASNTKARYKPEFSYSGQLELVVWSIPAMIVILLAGVAWIGSHQLDPAQPLAASRDRKPLRIEAVSLDWKWLFLYPDQGIAAVNQLTIPAGTPVEFSLTSATVMNAFFIPQLGSQIYTMPGMNTRLYLQADREGDYGGFSSHFSGDGFSKMSFVARAVPPATFDEWAASAKTAGRAWDDDVFAALKKPATSEPLLYANPPGGLFTRIIEESAPGSAMTDQTSPLQHAMHMKGH